MLFHKFAALSSLFLLLSVELAQSAPRLDKDDYVDYMDEEAINVPAAKRLAIGERLIGGIWESIQPLVDETIKTTSRSFRKQLRAELMAFSPRAFEDNTELLWGPELMQPKNVQSKGLQPRLRQGLGQTLDLLGSLQKYPSSSTWVAQLVPGINIWNWDWKGFGQRLTSPCCTSVGWQLPARLG